MSDTLMGRRKKMSMMKMPKAGTPEFGKMARMRGGKSAAEIREGRMSGDMRIKTARKRVKYMKNRTNRYLEGD